MGILRLYLALCVVHAHTGTLIPWPAQDGRQAVHSFFLISGFYMSMISGGRYQRVSNFYKSRALRIYGPYFGHLLAIIAISILSGLAGANWLALEAYATHPLQSNGWPGIAAATTANFTVFGLDWLMFFNSPAGAGLQFTWDFAKAGFPLYRYFVIPQCWSIGIELTFYAMVPLLAKFRSRYLLVLVGVSLALRFLAYFRFHLNADPWDYRFFPFELAFFVTGMLVERGYAKVSPLLKKSGSLGLVPLLLIGGAVLLGGYLLNRIGWKLSEHSGPQVATVMVVLAIAPLLPVLFHMTRNSPLDRWIGELSYPVYLNHLIIILAFHAWLPGLSKLGSTGLVIAIFSVAAAAVANHLVFSRLDDWRHKIFVASPKAP